MGNSLGSRHSRRAVLTTAGAGIAGLAGCTGGETQGATTGDVDPSAPFRNKTLRFSTWSGTNATVFEEEIKPAYEEKTGGTLEIVPGWAEILAKIRAAPADDPPYDLTVTGKSQHYIGVQEGLWEPLDVNALENADRLKPALLRDDPISVPVAYGVMCYAYDEQAIDWQPESWADLQEKATDAVLPGSFWPNALQMAAIVSERMPFDEELYSPTGHDAIYETLQSIDTAKYYTGAQDLWTALDQGIGTVGQYFFAYSKQKQETTETMDIGYHVPTETVGYIDDYHAVRGTDRLEMAADFMDFLLSPEMQSTYASAFNMGMATEDVDYPTATTENVPLTNEALQNVSFLEWADIAEYSETLTERFNGLKSST